MDRVWLLGVLHAEEDVCRAVDELETHAQTERNSLIAVARAVAEASARTLCSPSNNV
jgi:hypothetical protein